MVVSSGPVALAAETIKKSNKSEQMLTAYTQSILINDPLLESFLDAKDPLPFELGKLDANDKIVDRDPFLMRAQSWVTSKKSDTKSSGDDFIYERAKDKLLLTHSSWAESLVIHNALTPILDASEFLFFYG